MAKGMYPADIILPSLALTLGVSASVYFFAYWWRHRDDKHSRALLFWAIGLFLMYWFQVPAILTGLGKVITVTDFNLFFTLTLPITFLALIFFLLGIFEISGFDIRRKFKIFLFLWFGVAILFFAYYFIINGGAILTYFLPLGGNIIFYIPLRLIIIATAARIIFRSKLRTAAGIAGVVCVIGESVLGLARNFFIIDNVLKYPPQFWYVVIAQSKFFFITQTLSIIILVFGFYFLHLAYHRLVYGENR
ncbi:MAG: hypothetical protein HY432_00515 [Candidatus Liptonbacteria bacterium]|nr:hypothetical protein [Candidatus Liptonbacteria bacterium]